jgi:two-component system phosphate regulon sensor histidine kinase PhoR
MTASDINESISKLRVRISSAVIFILLLTGAVTLWQLKKIRRLVFQVSDYAGALAHGLFKKRLNLNNSGEFSEIAESLNKVAAELGLDKDEISEKTNRLDVILKSIPDALIIINPDRSIELANNKARELFGISRLERRGINEVIDSNDLSLLIERVTKSRRPESMELTIGLPRERHLFVWLSPLYYQVGELSGFVVLFHDISDFKKLEMVRKDFVANVSHEIKTPVTSIKGYAETLLDGALHDKDHAEKFLRIIKSHSERLNRLVEDLLTLSRLELGVTKVNKARYNLAEVVDSVAGMMDIQAAEKGLVITKSYDSKDMTADIDRDKTEQVLLNLLDNAIKFTEKGEIIIGIGREQKGHYLFVRDTGIGIPPESISRLGERFYRVDTSRSRELGGTGLGLAIVKHIVKVQGWEMKIESEKGAGTLVKVFFGS